MVITRSSLTVLIVSLGSCATAPEERPAQSASGNPTPVFRDPFTLTLHVDEEHYYEQEFGPVPFVHEGSVYLFKGDHFGIRLDGQGSPIYEPNVGQSDIEFELSQGISPNLKAAMLLVISNHTEQTITMHAWMTVPGEKGILETSILDVHPGQSGYESWPQPIVQLVLSDIKPAGILVEE